MGFIVWVYWAVRVVAGSGRFNCWVLSGFGFKQRRGLFASLELGGCFGLRELISPVTV